MVKKGWVKRVIKEEDRRARELSLTAKGNNVRTQLQPTVQNLQSEILRNLSDSEKELLVKLIKKVVVP